MNDNGLLIKITNNQVYSFFQSGELTEFILGSKNCQAQVKALHVEPYHVKFSFNGSHWCAEDLSISGNVRLNKRALGKKAIKIKVDDVISIFPPKHEGKKASLTVEVIKHFSRAITGTQAFIPLNHKSEHIIGRDEGCDIVVSNPMVEKRHSRIIYDESDCFIEDMHTISGTYVNNRKIKSAKLSNYDRISIAGAAYTFYDFKLLTSKSANGIEISAQNIDKEVADMGNKRKMIKLLNNITFTINAGEFVAVVGGSGAGKSTLMDCLTGVRPATGGKVCYDGNSYYENVNSYRGVVGIVPQRDIMHDDLTMQAALMYTARIRMRAQLSREEIQKHVTQAIADVKLTGKEQLKISSLSGGQKKRVSIAMELLADPKVIFLDEPTSGLSPDLDLEMMDLLKELASKGRTIIIITHAMDNIDKCDRVAFLGRGGRLCFYDKPQLLFDYFRQPNFAKIFFILGREEKAIYYAEKYFKTLPPQLLDQPKADYIPPKEPPPHPKHRGKVRGDFNGTESNNEHSNTDEQESAHSQDITGTDDFGHTEPLDPIKSYIKAEKRNKKKAGETNEQD